MATKDRKDGLPKNKARNMTSRQIQDWLTAGYVNRGRVLWPGRDKFLADVEAMHGDDPHVAKFLRRVRS